MLERCLQRVLVAVFLLGLMIVAMPMSSQAGMEELFAQQPEKDFVSVTAEVSPPIGKQPGQLSINVRIDPTWHIYSITQPPGGPLATEIEVRFLDGVRQVGDIRVEPLPEKKTEPTFDNLVIETHHDRVTWHIPIAIDSSVDLESLVIEGLIRVQPCNHDNCLSPKKIPFTARLARNVAKPTELPTLVGSGEPNYRPGMGREGRDTPNPVSRPEKLKIKVNDSLQDTSLAMIMGLGFLGGLILNLMPCVLPVIGLKILSFVQQAGQSRRRTLALNVWYSLGLLSVFVVLASLAVFRSLGWGQLFSFTGFNVTLIAIVFTMSLSLIGTWEIPIPGFFGSGKANDLSQREGALGAFCKGVLTTILATPCSGPFLASALAWAVGRPLLEAYAVFLSMGIGMASPYLLIGAFPSLIRFLPKPGEWMDTFKQLMGFVLLATVAYLLALLPWTYVVPTVTFLFSLWAACWWIGRVPPTSSSHEKIRAWLSATAFAAVFGFIAFGWLVKTMTSRFERTLQAAGSTTVSCVADHQEGELPWRPFTRKAFDELIASRNTVLVDFTADWCMTCKTLEKLVLNTPRMARVVRGNGVVTLRADWTHASPEVTQMLEQLGSKQVPVIAIFPAEDANHPIILRGGYTQEMLLDALKKAGPSNRLGLTAAKGQANRK
ncbi:MAG: thioredoxin family protein [Pirellulales bacterium]|nr:thioredoxin family protein [Pirellulales bacterium]